jgi:beta-galactosidase
MRSSDYLFFDITGTRSIIPLNGSWNVRAADDENTQKFIVSIPSIFEGEGELVFEKEFELTKNQITKNTLEIIFFSINYTADISLNDFIIYRHSGGEYPFRIELPRDILRSDKKNLLSLNLKYKLDSKNTIPQKQRFLSPQNFGGIVGDVFIHLKPDIYISKEKITKQFSPDYKSASMNIESVIRNNKAGNNSARDNGPMEYLLKISLVDEKGEIKTSPPDHRFTLNKNKDISINQKIDIKEPVYWTLENPSSNIIKFELLYGDSLLDVTLKSFAWFDLKSEKDAIKLNGNEIVLKGVTYYPSNTMYGNLLPYEQMEDDITLIKDAGFNCIRFAKSTIHPYYLKLCEEYGLLAFIEIPICDIPSGIAGDQSFINRGKDFVLNYLDFYGEYSALAGMGLGESYLPDLPEHISLISNLAALVKEKSRLITYASFFGKNLKEIESLDLYGLEVFKDDVLKSDLTIKDLQSTIGAGRIIFSSITYPVNIGGSDGYVNDFSFEAQAKFYEQTLSYILQNKIPAFFINSFIDYRGDYSSFICGYNENNLYKLGLLDEGRNKNRISYKVVFSKLNNLEKVTIPIGSRKDDSPMIFIVFGLLIAIFMGVLVNSGRKFREDASRALLRPYNFFSDVRDQRIISAYHTTLLGLIIAAVVALVASNILFHLKTSLLFENLVLSFANVRLMKTVNYLAWHPLLSLIWLTFFNIILFVVIALLIKTASLFVRSKVYINSIYFTVIWALLPVVLLIPVGIVLYRVLLTGSINIYIYIALIIVVLWIFYRLMKGIYVLFDSNPGTVYFYCSLFILAVAAIILFYFELQHSTIQYLLFTLKKFQIL